MKESTRIAIQRARNRIDDDTELHREARGILYGILNDKDEME